MEVSDRSSRSRLAVLAVAAVVLLIATACGGTAGDTTSTAPGGTNPAGGDPVEISVWFALDYQPDDLFAELEAEHNIRVVQDVRPLDTIVSTLLQMQDAGEPLPDLIEDVTATMPALVQAGLLLPLNDPDNDLFALYQEEAPDDFANVNPLAWEDGTFDGQVYHAALMGNYEVLYYDAEAFDEAGVDAGGLETWDDVLEAARSLKAARPDAYPFSIPASADEFQNGFFQQMVSSGVPFDGAIPNLNSPAGLYTIEWYQTMVAEELIDPQAANWGEDDARGAFIGRRATLMMEGLNTAKDFREVENYEYGEQWATALIPLMTEDGAEPGVPSIVPRGWSILAATEHPYEASLVLRYLLEEEQAVTRTISGHQPPRLLSDMEGLAEYAPHFTPEIREGFDIARAKAPHLDIVDIELVWQTLLNDLVSGRSDAPEVIAAEYQAQFDAFAGG